MMGITGPKIRGSASLSNLTRKWILRWAISRLVTSIKQLLTRVSGRRKGVMLPYPNAVMISLGFNVRRSIVLCCTISSVFQSSQTLPWRVTSTSRRCAIWRLSFSSAETGHLRTREWFAKIEKQSIPFSGISPWTLPSSTTCSCWKTMRIRFNPSSTTSCSSSWTLT